MTLPTSPEVDENITLYQPEGTILKLRSDFMLEISDPVEEQWHTHKEDSFGKSEFSEKMPFYK